LSLLGRALGRGDDTVTPQAQDFVVRDGIRVTAHRRRDRRAELAARGEDERRDLAPVPSHCERNLRNGILPPHACLGRRKVVDADAGLAVLRAVLRPQREDRGRGFLTELDPGRPVRARQRPDVGKIGSVDLVQARGLRREHRHQRVVRRGGDRRIDRDIAARARQGRVALVTPDDRVHRVEHGDVHDRDRAAGSTRAKLFAEHARLAGLDRRVVDAARVDRHLVPEAQAVDIGRTSPDRHRNLYRGRRSKLRTERIAKAAGEIGGDARAGQERNQEEAGHRDHASTSQRIQKV
jgi:hypothetical protein